MENRFWRWEYDLPASRWHLQAHNGWSIQGAHIRLRYRPGSGRQQQADFQFDHHEADSGSVAVAGRRVKTWHLPVSIPSSSLRGTLSCAMLNDQPGFIWKLRLGNHGHQAIYIERLDLLALDPDGGRLETAGESPEHLAFFSNGWQSWSHTRVYRPRERQWHTRLGPLRRGEEQFAAYPTRPGVFTSEMFGVLGSQRTRQGLLAGFLSQQQYFGRIQARLDQANPQIAIWSSGDGIQLDPGAEVESDWACLFTIAIDASGPLDAYLSAVALQHDPGLQTNPLPTPTGWCSWYQYSTESYTGALSEGDVRLNLHAVQAARSSLPLDLVQIDDGFESQVGDWFSFAPTFPDGVQTLASDIQQVGCTPGLWLAPFILHPASQTARAHPQWLLRDPLGRPVRAGFLWNTFPAALDTTHPDALYYAKEVVHTAVHKWGYPYLKLDFLYAAALAGRHHDPTQSRAQALHRGLVALRQAAGNQAFLVGCGCPLGPAVGLVDSMRVSADTSRRWKPSFGGISLLIGQETSVPAARNAVHNTLTRAALHRQWWINDPDCLLLRPETHITPAELQSCAATIALSGGSMLLSDDISRLPDERLNMAAQLLPVLGKRPQVLDWFDSATPRRVRLDLENQTGMWHLLALYNWSDHPEALVFQPGDFHLPRADYSIRRFWTHGSQAAPQWLATGHSLTLPELPAHGVWLVAVRRVHPGEAMYLGSDLHISQGMEITHWAPAKNGLRIRFERPGPAHGSCYLTLPQAPRRASQDGIEIQGQAQPRGIYQYQLQFNRAAELKIEW